MGTKVKTKIDNDFFIEYNKKVISNYVNEAIAKYSFQMIYGRKLVSY